MLVGDAGQRRDDDDHGQPDQADFGDVQGQRDDHQHRHHRLHDQQQAVARRLPGTLRAFLVEQDLAHARRQFAAVAEPPELLDQPAGKDAGKQRRDTAWRHLEQEFHEVPAGLVADDYVFRFADQRTHAADGGADGAVHEQAAQHGAELFEVLAVLFEHMLVGELRVVVMAARRHHAVIDLVEAERDGDEHGEDGKRVEEGRGHRNDGDDHQIERDARTDAEQDAADHAVEHVAQEVHAGNHEDHQQQYRQAMFDFVIDRVRVGQSQRHRLQGEQSAGLQRKALQGHGQREDEFAEDQPAGW